MFVTSKTSWADIQVCETTTRITSMRMRTTMRQVGGNVDDTEEEVREMLVISTKT
jgi:hypothetical protein